MCVRAVGLVDRSDLSKLVLEAPPAQLAGLTSRLVGHAVAAGGALSAGERVVVRGSARPRRRAVGPGTGSTPARAPACGRGSLRDHDRARPLRRCSGDRAARSQRGQGLAGARSVRRVRRSARGAPFALGTVDGIRDLVAAANPIAGRWRWCRASVRARPGWRSSTQDGRSGSAASGTRRPAGTRCWSERAPPRSRSPDSRPGLVSDPGTGLTWRPPQRRAGRVARARARDRRARLRAPVRRSRARDAMPSAGSARSARRRASSTAPPRSSGRAPQFDRVLIGEVRGRQPAGTRDLEREHDRRREAALEELRRTPIRLEYPLIEDEVARHQRHRDRPGAHDPLARGQTR